MNSLNLFFERVRRIRYRKGHNIHSPRIFRLIEYVTDRSLSFYRLDELKKRKAVTDTEEVLFKLIVYLKPDKLFYCGASVSENEEVAETAASGNWKPLAAYLPVTEETNGSVLLYARLNQTAEEEIDRIISLLQRQGKGFNIIIDGIFENETNQNRWQKIIQKPAARTSLDFITFGLLLNDTDLHPQHYKIYC